MDEETDNSVTIAPEAKPEAINKLSISSVANNQLGLNGTLDNAGTRFFISYLFLNDAGGAWHLCLRFNPFGAPIQARQPLLNAQ